MTLRVLYLAPDPALTLDQQGGAGTHMRGTIGGLRALGVDVHSVVGSPPGADADLTAAQRAHPVLRRLAPRPLRLLARDVRLVEHARGFREAAYPRVDCVFERSAYLVDAGRAIAHAQGALYALETDGMLVDARRRTYGVALARRGARLERSKIASADIVAAQSEASRDELADRYQIPPSRLIVKGLGVGADVLSRPTPAQPTFDVGWAGTFQAYHGVDLLLGALRHLPDTSTRLVGDGPLRRELEASAEGLLLRFEGLLPRRVALDQLEQCRVLVIPESAEFIYPIKFLEYAALRRPIVCPRRRAFTEFESGGSELVFSFEPGNIEDLARAITEAAGCLDDRVERLRALVAEHYTWQAAATRVIEAIEAVRSERASAPSGRIAHA